MLRVYGMSSSGNCYKIRLLLTQLQRPFEWVEVDTLKQQTHTPEFLAKNPNAKVPLVEFEDGTFLRDSKVIAQQAQAGTLHGPGESAPLS